MVAYEYHITKLEKKIEKLKKDIAIIKKKKEINESEFSIERCKLEQCIAELETLVSVRGNLLTNYENKVRCLNQRIADLEAKRKRDNEELADKILSLFLNNSNQWDLKLWYFEYKKEIIELLEAS